MQGEAKLSGGGFGIAELTFGQPQLQIKLGRRFYGKRMAQFASRGKGIILLGVDSC